MFSHFLVLHCTLLCIISFVHFATHSLSRSQLVLSNGRVSNQTRASKWSLILLNSLHKPFSNLSRSRWLLPTFVRVVPFSHCTLIGVCASCAQRANKEQLSSNCFHFFCLFCGSPSPVSFGHLIMHSLQPLFFYLTRTRARLSLSLALWKCCILHDMIRSLLGYLQQKSPSFWL